MKVNINTLKRCIMNSSELGYPRIEEHNENDETILRFKDTNGYTLSIYNYKDELIIGYLLKDETYKWWSTINLTKINSNADLMFMLAIKLVRLSDYIEKEIA